MGCNYLSPLLIPVFGTQMINSFSFHLRCKLSMRDRTMSRDRLGIRCTKLMLKERFPLLNFSLNQLITIWALFHKIAPWKLAEKYLDLGNTVILHRGVTAYRKLDCLFKSLFRLTTKTIWKLGIIGPLRWDSVSDRWIIPNKWPLMRKVFPGDGVVMSHHILP